LLDSETVTVFRHREQPGESGVILGIILRDSLGAILRLSPLLSFRRLTATRWSDVVVDRKG
jgi:hypothetical protein